MSVPKITGVQLSEPSAGPLLLLGNSIGTSATALWAASAAFLGERFHVVAWDLPGHGRNTDPVSDGFSMAELAAGVMAFAERVLTDRGEDPVRRIQQCLEPDRTTERVARVVQPTTRLAAIGQHSFGECHHAGGELGHGEAIRHWIGVSAVTRKVPGDDMKSLAEEGRTRRPQGGGRGAD